MPHLQLFGDATIVPVHSQMYSESGWSDPTKGPTPRAGWTHTQLDQLRPGLFERHGTPPGLESCANDRRHLSHLLKQQCGLVSFVALQGQRLH
jgi:hypothetical protein